MIEELQQTVAGFPAWATWIGILLVSAIPFVESYFGAMIGVAVGLPPVAAVSIAIVGNTLSMLAFVLTAHAARTKITSRGRSEGTVDRPLSRRQEKVRGMLDRYGVPGVSLLGQTLLPSQITSAAMVGFGASHTRVIRWQILSIALWGILFGALAALGVYTLQR